MNTAIDPSFDLFSITDEHHELRAAIRALTERDIIPYAADCDERERFPQEALDASTSPASTPSTSPRNMGVKARRRRSDLHRGGGGCPRLLLLVIDPGGEQARHN